MSLFPHAINRVSPSRFQQEQEVGVSREEQPVGLFNRGTDCFLNAARQFAYNTPIKYIISHRHSSPLYEDFRNYQKQPRGRPMGGSRVIRNNDAFRSMQIGQQCAHDALMKIFNEIPHHWDASLGHGIVTNPLSNAVEHLRDGVVCEVVLEGFLPLPIHAANGSLMRNMQEVWDYYTEEKLEEEKLERDNTVVVVRHQSRFQSLPDHLLFSLNRYTSGGEVIETKTTFKLDDKHVKTGESANFHIEAFIVHRGTPTFGHYTAYVCVKKQWFLCNDTRITPIFSEKQVEQAMGRAYIFYARRSDLADHQVKDSFFLAPEPPTLSLDYTAASENTPLQSEVERVEQIAPFETKETPRSHKTEENGVLQNVIEAGQKPKRAWKVITILHAVGYYAFYLPLYYIAKAVHAVARFVMILPDEPLEPDHIESAGAKLIEALEEPEVYYDCIDACKA